MFMSYDKKKLLSLFYKSYFKNGEIIKNGIKYIAEPFRDFEKINIYSENVGDVSTTRLNQIIDIEDLLYDFSKILSDKNFNVFKILLSDIQLYTDLGKNEVYLNKKDSKTLMDLYETYSKNTIKYKNQYDIIIDVDYILKFISVSIYGDEIVVNDMIKVNYMFFDGIESDNVKSDFSSLYDSDDGFYDYFRDSGEFGEIVSFLYHTLIDPDSSTFVTFNHKFIF